MLYFTGDTHFADPRVLRIDRRPFKTLPDHDEALVENWNDAFFMVEIEGGRERCRPAIWVSLYGHEASRASEVSLHVHELLQREFRT